MEPCPAPLEMAEMAEMARARRLTGWENLGPNELGRLLLWNSAERGIRPKERPGLALISPGQPEDRGNFGDWFNLLHKEWIDWFATKQLQRIAAKDRAFCPGDPNLGSSLYWDGEYLRVRDLRGLRDAVIRCQSAERGKRYRMAAIPLLIAVSGAPYKKGEHCNHVNMVLASRTDANSFVDAELWEPHGVGGPGVDRCDPKERLYPTLAWFLGAMFGWKLDHPQMACPLNALNGPGGLKGQAQGIIPDRDSFCTAWSFLYLEMRVRYSRRPATQIAQFMNESLSRDPFGAQQRIRAYALGMADFARADAKKDPAKSGILDFRARWDRDGMGEPITADRIREVLGPDAPEIPPAPAFAPAARTIAGPVEVPEGLKMPTVSPGAINLERYELLVTGLGLPTLLNGRIAALSKTYPWLCSLERKGGTRADLTKIRWDPVSDELVLKNPNKFKATVRACLADASVRMIAIPLNISGEGCGHANMLIFDKSTNTVEHWEPHGLRSDKWQCDPNGKLHPALEWFFRSAFGWKYARAQETCPFVRKHGRGGLQGRFASDEFCFTWSMASQDPRVANPELTGGQVSERLTETFRKMSATAVQSYVEGYAISLMAGMADIPKEEKLLYPAIGATAFGRFFSGEPVGPYPAKEPGFFEPFARAH